MDRSHINRIVGRFASQRILVVGDLMLDEFIWGKVSRISPEAPVPVVNVTSESYYPGGAANVARNVREFTAHTAVMGAVGTDAPGERLLRLLRDSGIDTTGIQQSAICSTTLKTRIIARNQQVVRVDRERKVALDAGQIEHAISYLDGAASELDAVIVADYGKGFFAQPLADHICEWARRHRKILTIDPHPHTSLIWNGPTAVKPNRSEAFLAAGVPASDAGEPVLADHALLEAGQRLLAKWNTGSLLITLGEQGMLLLQPQSAPYHVPSRAQTVFDVSGAGDTAIAVFTMALSAGASMSEAAAIANCASGIVVGKLGTATVGMDELLGAIAAL
jgi:D-glycero-beta-D-manno-heptose-7-phosphate kinase